MNLGIDIGSSFIKTCLLGESSISHIKRVKSPSSGPEVNGKHEVNPKLFLEIVISLIDEYLNKHEDINGIYISTQMHCFVMVDELGNPCSDLITWKDRRSEEFFVGKLNTIDWFKKNISSDILLQTGMGVRSGLPSLNLFVLERQNKINNTMSFGTIGDYLISSITNTPISTSLSNAAGTGLFNLEENCWNNKLIDLLGLKLQLPKIHRKSNEPIGSYNKVDVFSSIGDQQASLLGLEEDLSKVAVSNIATGSQATVISESLILNHNFQTRPFINNSYILTIPFIPAGRVLNSLINLLMEVNNKFFNGSVEVDEVWERFINFTNEIDLDKNHISPLIINTDLIGSFSTDGGSISGMNENNFQLKDIVLAFVVDIASNHSYALEVLREQKNFESIIISGGISQKLSIIKKILESRQDTKVSVSHVQEDALNGLRVLSTGKVEIW
jgi:sugar (pentulose or hexulose) kinase